MERKWLVRWLYASAIAHLVVGLALPWISSAAALGWYHAALGPAEAHGQQAWWLALFGPTIQCVGLWMLALIHFGEKYRAPAAWLWIGAGMLLWGPQDIMVSLRADVWANVWIDVASLVLLLPAIWRLYILDRRAPATEAV
ncbi:cell division protein [Pseudoduganella sp. OTU4001]|uniref:cell division protein n=1 Tax=Pseudoduganella sp. OTU4001 TaxID=3043854 RepID=UPI00313E7506